MPRMPVHASRKTADHGGKGSRRLSAGLRSRGSTAASGTQTRRIPIATALITAPYRTTRAGLSPRPASRIARSWSPISTKMTPFRTKTRRSQTARARIRVAGGTAVLKPRRT